MAYNKGSAQLNNASAKKKPPKVNIGGVSIVVVFAVLCLTVFAVLSLITANTEKTLVHKYTYSVSNYYAADMQCSQISQQIVAAISKAGINDKDFLSGVNALGVSVGSDGSRYYFDYAFAIDDNQELRVRLAADSVSDVSPDILMWQVFDIGSWEPDFSLNVWKGED